MNNKKSIFVLGAIAVLAALIAFAASFSSLGTQASAQQQTPADPHHPETGNQSSSPALPDGIMGQFFGANGMSLVDEVKVTGISIVGEDHILVNLRYYGEGAPPGVSVVAITHSSAGMMGMGMMMQQNPVMMGQEGGMMMGQMESSNLSQAYQQMQNSTSVSITMKSMQSGGNYLESGWQDQQSNSATVLVELDGDTDGGHIMVMVVPFIHH